MKKAYWVIGIVAVLLIAALLTFYFLRIEPYRKITSHLKAQNWSAATALCRSRLMNEPNNTKYLGFLFYARMRAIFDEDMRSTVADLDNDDIAEVNGTLYMEHDLPEILSALMNLETMQYILDHKLFDKNSDYKLQVKSILGFSRRILSTNVKADKLAKALQFMSEFGTTKMNLDKGDVIDNFYYNIFLAMQSAGGNLKSDDILLKRLTVDSSIAQLFPFCGEGLRPKLSEILKTKPQMSDKEAIYEYFAIMKAADMIKDINKLYPKATGIEKSVEHLESVEKENSSNNTEKELMVEAWKYLSGSEVFKEVNLHYNKKRSEVLKTNKHFDLDICLLQPDENDDPVIMTINIFDHQKQKHVMWAHVFREGDFQRISFQNKSNPFESDYIPMVKELEDESGKLVFTMSSVKHKKESYKVPRERYNPKKYRYYDYWYGYYYEGGWDTYQETKYRDIVVLTEQEEFRLNGNKATLEKSLKEEKVENLPSYIPDYEEEDYWYHEHEYHYNEYTFDPIQLIIPALLYC